jgi:sphingomyelin phosphodiesterase acid-like 3
MLLSIFAARVVSSCYLEERCALRLVFGFAAALALALSKPVRGAEPETVRPVQFLMMSDVHFDPMADPKLVDRLALAEPEEWQAILESSADKSLGRYGVDSSWALLGSALWQAKQMLSNPAFVILPGDFLPHNFRRRFGDDAADHSDAAYRLFVRKTMQFLASQLDQTFPDTPILPTWAMTTQSAETISCSQGGHFWPIPCPSFARSSVH